MPLPDTFWDDTSTTPTVPIKTTVDIESWEEERLAESRKIDAQNGGLRALMFGLNYGSGPPPAKPRTISPTGSGGWPRGKMTNFFGGHYGSGSKTFMSPRLWEDILGFAAPSNNPKSDFGARKILEQWDQWLDDKKAKIKLKEVRNKPARQINAVTNGVPAIVNSQLPGEDAPPDWTTLPTLPSWLKDDGVDGVVGIDFETTPGPTLLQDTRVLKPTSTIQDSSVFNIEPKGPPQGFSWPKPDKDWK